MISLRPNIPLKKWQFCSQNKQEDITAKINHHKRTFCQDQPPNRLACINIAPCHFAIPMPLCTHQQYTMPLALNPTHTPCQNTPCHFACMIHIHIHVHTHTSTYISKSPGGQRMTRLSCPCHQEEKCQAQLTPKIHIVIKTRVLINCNKWMTTMEAH